MSLFGYGNMSREGPGVKKNAPKKYRFFAFWDIVFNKFFKLVKLNLLYLLFCLPLVTFGPATAALTYVTKNMANEKYVQVWGDFVDAFKSNFKQSFLYGILHLFIIFSIIVNFRFYSHEYIKDLLPFDISIWYYIIPTIFFYVLFFISSFYIYQMIVSIELKFRHIVGNALRFIVLGVVKNLIVLACLILIVSVLIGIGQIVAILITFLFLFSFTSLVINFNVYPVIYKYIIEPQEKENPKDDEIIFRD